MTERQKSLHDEIIRISDIFQLGLGDQDTDWFYKFIRRMDENAIWEQSLFLKLDFLSNDFLNEFPRILEGILIKDATKFLSLLGFSESLKHIPARYEENLFVKYIRDIKDNLKEEWIEEHIKLFDNSCLTASDFTYSNRDPKSAWYYVFQSNAVSAAFKEKYKDKSVYTDIYDEKGNANNEKEKASRAGKAAYYSPKYVKIIEGIRQK